MFKKKMVSRKGEREYFDEPGYPKLVNQMLNVNGKWTK